MKILQNVKMKRFQFERDTKCDYRKVNSNSNQCGLFDRIEFLVLNLMWSVIGNSCNVIFNLLFIFSSYIYFIFSFAVTNSCCFF